MIKKQWLIRKTATLPGNEMEIGFLHLSDFINFLPAAKVKNWHHSIDLFALVDSSSNYKNRRAICYLTDHWMKNAIQYPWVQKKVLTTLCLNTMWPNKKGQQQTEKGDLGRTCKKSCSSLLAKFAFLCSSSSRRKESHKPLKSSYILAHFYGLQSREAAAVLVRGSKVKPWISMRRSQKKGERDQPS